MGAKISMSIHESESFFQIKAPFIIHFNWCDTGQLNRTKQMTCSFTAVHICKLPIIS